MLGYGDYGYVFHKYWYKRNLTKNTAMFNNSVNEYYKLLLRYNCPHTFMIYYKSYWSQ